MKKILIVDDNSDIRRLLRWALGQRHQILEAKSAEEATQHVIDDRPDLILLDILMPGMNGVDWARMIKQMAQLQSVKIIMVSALDKPDVIQDSLSAGACDYITKPFSLSEVSHKVEAALCGAPH